MIDYIYNHVCRVTDMVFLILFIMKSRGYYFRKFVFGMLLCASVSFFVSCSKDEEPDSRAEVDNVTQLVNRFVLMYNEYYYLWNNKINYDNKDPRYIEDPFALFDSLIYKDLDIWSYLTNDANALFDSYNGVETAYGYRLVVARTSDEAVAKCIAVVKFVYPGSPAEKAGIKRGDVLCKMNGSYITTENYLDLYYSSSIELKFGEYSAKDNTIYELDKTVSLTASKFNIDAVNAWSVIELGTHKIGYICYTDYVESSHEKLAQICADFKSRKVTDVILDLRYNPGGAAASAAYLSSLFVPKSVLDRKGVFLKQIWNSNLTNYLTSEGTSLTTTFNALAANYNLNLSRIFVLTTSGTASASEATIVGLAPYMNVVRIGSTTHGKYCGALLLRAVDKDGDVISLIDNWAMSLVVYKFANNSGYTDFTGGLAPDYEVEDNLFGTYPLGNVNDPLIAKAVELITGITQNAAANSQSVKSSSGVLQKDGGFTILKDETNRLNSRRGGFVELAN